MNRKKACKGRRWLSWMTIVPMLAVALLAKGYWNATRDPIIHTASVKVSNWPEGERPLNILLLSDIHVAGPDMPPSRLKRLVEQFNELTPDLILIAGDLVSQKKLATHFYAAKEVVAPLAGLRAPLGVIVAPGNHDHWFDPDALRDELQAIGLTVLRNEAVTRGPLAIGGVDDDFTGHANLAQTFDSLDKLPDRPRILLTHSPDIVPALPSAVAAVFAGHTHCGQIVIPFVGAISYVSRYGNRFSCGDIDYRGQRVFVTAGLGTSLLPLRYGALPDAWLVTLGPKKSSRQSWDLHR